MTMAFLLAAGTARADALGDLRAALGRLGARDAVQATVTIDTSSRDGDDGRPEVGKATFEVEHGPRGLRLTYAPELIARAQQEARLNELDPEKPTPARTGMRRIDAADLMEALDAGSAMARRLETATLIREQRVTLGGRSVRQLTLKLQPRLSKSEAKRIKNYELTLIVPIDDDGVPLRAEMRQKVKAKFLLMTFEQNGNQTWVFARTGDRLVAVRHEDRSSGSGMGQKFENHEVMTLALKNGSTM
jgi:hypothetical protein